MKKKKAIHTKVRLWNTLVVWNGKEAEGGRDDNWKTEGGSKYVTKKKASLNWVN